MTFLGIDLGTSSLKAVLVDSSQTVLADAFASLSTSHPRPGWSEQEPAAWWVACERVLAEIRAAQPAAFAALRGIGLSGQMHGAVLVDRDGEPIRPAILWNDSRSTHECAELMSAVPGLPLIAGIVAMPSFIAPKLLWLARHEPENLKRVAKVLLPKDFLRLKLTGDAVTDMSDAAGTLLLDQRARRWSEPLLAASGVDEEQMPRLVEGSAPAGVVRRAVLDAWGVTGSVVVAGGAGDAAAACIGIGAVEEGDAFASIGTSAQLFVTDARYRPQPGTMLHAFAHALPHRWFRMAAMLNGATCLQWLAGWVGDGDVDGLLRGAEASWVGPSRVLYLPYLAGERTPHNDAAARGVFAGLDPDCGAGDLAQAVVEGIAFSFLEARLLLEEAGVQLPAIGAVGGGARSRFFMQVLAHVIGVNVVRYAGVEKGPAFGAARLAILAVEQAPAAEVCGKPDVLDILEPAASLHTIYAERFEVWRRLYRGLKPEFAAMQTA